VTAEHLKTLAKVDAARHVPPRETRPYDKSARCPRLSARL
jgi:hypothetical protein